MVLADFFEDNNGPDPWRSFQHGQHVRGPDGVKGVRTAASTRCPAGSDLSGWRQVGTIRENLGHRQVQFHYTTSLGHAALQPDGRMAKKILMTVELL
jgi:hypothetical protein